MINSSVQIRGNYIIGLKDELYYRTGTREKKSQTIRRREKGENDGLGVSDPSRKNCYQSHVVRYAYTLISYIHIKEHDQLEVCLCL